MFKILFATLLLLILSCTPSQTHQNSSTSLYTLCAPIGHRLSPEWLQATKKAVLEYNRAYPLSTPQRSFLKLLKASSKKCLYENDVYRIVDESYFPFKIPECQTRAYAFYAPLRRMIVICSNLFTAVYTYGPKLHPSLTEPHKIIRAYGRHRIVMHEIGHWVFGLKHSSDPSCIMSTAFKARRLCYAEIEKMKITSPVERF